MTQTDARVLRVPLERVPLHTLQSDTPSSFQPQGAERGMRLSSEAAGDIAPVLLSPVLATDDIRLSVRRTTSGIA